MDINVDHKLSPQTMVFVAVVVAALIFSKK